VKLLLRLNTFRLRRLSIRSRIFSTPCRILAPFSYWQQRQASTSKDVSADDARRIHVHGTAPLSLFIAHRIASCPNAPPATLLTHSNRRLQSFSDIGRKITIICEGSDEESCETDGVSMEVVPKPNGLMVPIRPGAKHFMLRVLYLNPEGDLFMMKTTGKV
jgi:hypothetical protein